MKNWLIYLLLCTSTTACDGVLGEIDSTKSGYFVQAYFELEGIKTYLHYNNSIWLYEIYYYQSQLPVWYGLTSNRGKFLEMSKKHGDKNFNRWILDDMSPKNDYFANDFAEITITSDAAFDAAHPAGTPLNDIVRLLTITPTKFIRSGYKEKFNWNKYQKISFFNDYYPQTLQQPDEYCSSSVTLGRQHIFPVYKLVSELEPDDMALWGRGAIHPNQQMGSADPFAVFEFTKKPETPGEHNISIVLKTDEGKTYHLAPVGISFQ